MIACQMMFENIALLTKQISDLVVDGKEGKKKVVSEHTSICVCVCVCVCVVCVDMSDSLQYVMT